MKPFTKPGLLTDPIRAAALSVVFRDIEQMPFNRSQTRSVSDTGTADTEFSVSHNLGRVPSGFVVTKTNKAGIVYDSGTAWTATAIYLKCSAANTAVTLQVF